jgi:hypothetical protein
MRWFVSRTSDDPIAKHQIKWGQWARKHRVRLTLLAIPLLTALSCRGRLAVSDDRDTLAR